MEVLEVEMLLSSKMSVSFFFTMLRLAQTFRLVALSDVPLLTSPLGIFHFAVNLSPLRETVRDLT